MKIPLNWSVPIIRIIYEIWCRTLRVEEYGRHYLDDLINAREPVILVFWHDEIFPLMHVRQKQRFAAIVSQSKDGELLARFLEGMDIKTARGSSSRGGVTALLQATRLLRKEKRVLCISVDGPRGPRHEVKGGIIHLARVAKAKVVPIRIYMARRKVFASWDRFQLPLPFSKVSIVYGPPYKPEPTIHDDTINFDAEVQKIKYMLDNTFNPDQVGY